MQSSEVDLPNSCIPGSPDIDKLFKEAKKEFEKRWKKDHKDEMESDNKKFVTSKISMEEGKKGERFLTI